MKNISKILNTLIISAMSVTLVGMNSNNNPLDQVTDISDLQNIIVDYLDNWEVIDTYRGSNPSNVVSVEISNHKILASNNQIKIINTETYTEKNLNGHSDTITSLAVSGDKIVSGSVDKTIRTWDIQAGQLEVLRGHTNTVTSVIVSGNNIISGSLDKTVKIWDLNSGKLLYTLDGHITGVRSVIIYGDTIMSGSDDNIIKTWANRVFALRKLINQSKQNAKKPYCAKAEFIPRNSDGKGSPAVARANPINK